MIIYLVHGHQYMYHINKVYSYRPPAEYDGRLTFYVCVPVHGGGGNPVFGPRFFPEKGIPVSSSRFFLGEGVHLDSFCGILSQIGQECYPRESMRTQYAVGGTPPVIKQEDVIVRLMFLVSSNLILKHVISFIHFMYLSCFQILPT